MCVNIYIYVCIYFTAVFHRVFYKTFLILMDSISSSTLFRGSSAGPAPVQYQPAAATLYQSQSGSPPSSGLPRVSLTANQQAASVRSPLPLGPGVSQQQQVTIQVQEVELGAGPPRQANFLSTLGGHRVLGKQLSADNAESHR